MYLILSSVDMKYVMSGMYRLMVHSELYLLCEIINFVLD